MDGELDFTAKILAALTREVEPEEAPVMLLEDQISFLQRNVDTISIEDRKSLGDILVSNGKKSELRPCSEGTVINLNALPPDIINQMYNLMVYKREKRK